MQRGCGPIIEAIRTEGKTSFNAIAGELSSRGILTANGGRWHATTVRKLLTRGADAAQSAPMPSPSNDVSEEPDPRWTYVLGPKVGIRFKSEAQMIEARETYIREVWAFVAGGSDDPGGSRAAWCKANAGKIVEMAIWAAEKKLLSYWLAGKALKQVRDAADGLSHGLPRAKRFLNQVRSEHARLSEWLKSATR
jgi:hypothetical protein